MSWKVDHVGIPARDLDEAIAFFADCLGLAVIERWDSPRQAFVGRDDLVLGLIEDRERPLPAPTVAHVALPCLPAEFDALAERLTGRPGTVVVGPRDQRGGRSVIFRDPTGNLFEICYPPVRRAEE